MIVGGVSEAVATVLNKKVWVNYPMICRQGWDMFRVVSYDDDPDKKEHEIVEWELRNGEGMATGKFWSYEPSADDLAATDWKEYVKPTFEEFEAYQANRVD